MPPEDDDEFTDIRNFQDIRMELHATGHNLVSPICVRALFTLPLNHNQSRNGIDFSPDESP
jgi:hypothetical protein